MGPGGGVMPVIHERPATGEANELLAFERALFWLRLVAGAVIVVLAAGARQGPLPLVAEAVAIEISGALALWVALRPGLSLTPLRRQAVLLLVADMAAVYVTGTAFAAEADWMAYAFY